MYVPTRKVKSFASFHVGNFVSSPPSGDQLNFEMKVMDQGPIVQNKLTFKRESEILDCKL